MTATIIIPLAGIALSVFIGDTVPNQTILWLVLFLASMILIAVAEIKAYLHRHREVYNARKQEKTAMADLIKNRLLTAEKTALVPGDETKLVEQMANELKARLASSKSLSAENVKQITSELTSKIPQKT